MRIRNIKTNIVVAIGVGAALFGVLKLFSIPIGPNTSFVIAFALLVILAAYFGPVAGFFIGLLGHALADAINYGSVWWSWTMMSAMIGLFAGLITLDKTFSISDGMITKVHIFKMYVFAILGMLAGSVLSYFGDVFLYGEPAKKVWIQILIANAANLIVVAVIGIPVVIVLAKLNSKSVGIDSDDNL